MRVFSQEDIDIKDQYIKYETKRDDINRKIESRQELATSIIKRIESLRKEVSDKLNQLSNSEKKQCKCKIQRNCLKQ